MIKRLFFHKSESSTSLRLGQFAMNEHKICVPNSFNFSGKGNKPYISLPKGKGIKLSIAEERDKRLSQK